MNQPTWMILKKLHLRNFRNYACETISFSPYTNVFVGDNAQGKTNLLEAIYLLSTGKSFRTNHLEELIQENKEFFYIEASIQKNGFEQIIKIYFHRQKKMVWINHTKFSSFSSLIGYLPSVFYSPSDSASFISSPTARRRFLNIFLSQYNLLYVFHLTRYFKALKHRNKLLKEKKLSTILVWEKQLAKSADYLTSQRKILLTHFNNCVRKFLSDLTNHSDRINLEYFCSHPHLSHNDFLSSLTKMRHKDLLYGHTSIGPHRDDIVVNLNDKNIKLFASEGQKQSAFFAIKLSEWHTLKEKMGESPLLQIDDFGSHLDQKRKKLLKTCVHDLSQVFITSPNQKENWQNYFIQGQCFQIKNGQVFSSKLF